MEHRLVEKLDGSRKSTSARRSEQPLLETLSVRPDAIAILGQDLKALGLDATTLLRNVGLVPEAVAEVGKILGGWGAARLSADQIVQVYAEAARLSHDEWLGLRLGARRGLSWLGPLGKALVQAPTVLNAIEVGQRFIGLLVDGQELHAERRAGRYRMSTTLPAGLDPTGGAVILQSTLVLMANVVDELVRGPFLPVTLRFACARPHREAILRPVQRSGRSLRFDADSWSLEIPTACLGLAPRSGAGPEEASFIVGQLEAELQRLKTSRELDAHLRLQLLIDLAQGPRLGPTARRLGLAPRTLQLRLAELGTSFQRELAVVRVDVARRYLRGTSEPVSVIAARLGFGSAEAFSRFFRTADGRSPRGYRIETPSTSGDRSSGEATGGRC